MLLYMWTIYENPRDYPNLYVLRRFTILPGVEPIPDPKPIAVEATAALVRRHLPPWRTCFGRQPDDDPTILESWI